MINMIWIQTDIRYDDQIERAINETLRQFGGLDIIVHAANVFVGSSSAQIDMSRFDLMHQILPRSLFLLAKYGVNHMIESANPHILTLAPRYEEFERSTYSKTAYGVGEGHFEYDEQFEDFFTHEIMK